MGVTHLSGISTRQTVGHPLFDYGMPDPTQWVTFFEDFASANHRFPLATSGLAAASTGTPYVVTVTENGTGHAASDMVDGTGGLLQLICDTADNDSIFAQVRGEAFRWSASKRLFFTARFKVSDATQSDLVLGLQIRDTTPLDVSDGIFFQKDDGDANLDFYVEKNNTASSDLAFATISNDTFLVLSFVYDPNKGLFTLYKDGVGVGSVAGTTNAPDDEDLTVSFGIQNGEGSSKSMTIDYILCALER